MDRRTWNQGNVELIQAKPEYIGKVVVGVYWKKLDDNTTRFEVEWVWPEDAD